MFTKNCRILPRNLAAICLMLLPAWCSLWMSLSLLNLVAQNCGQFTCFSAMTQNIDVICLAAISAIILLTCKLWVLFQFSIMTELDGFLASGFLWWFRALACGKSLYGPVQSLVQSPYVPRAVEADSWQWVHGSVSAQDCHQMSGGRDMAVLSLNIYLHSWLPREVCTFFFLSLSSLL